MHGLPRVPNLRTNRVQTVPRIPEPPTAIPSNPFSGPSEEFSIVYPTLRRLEPILIHMGVPQAHIKLPQMSNFYCFLGRAGGPPMLS
jgi:hypothetical protein